MGAVEVETVSLVEGAPDRALWRAVISQAFTDAVVFVRDDQKHAPARRLERDRAVAFLTTPSSWFNIVCEMADLEPSQVQRLARKFIQDADNRAAEREATHLEASARAARAGRRARRYEVDNRSLTLAEWSRELGVSVATIRLRLERGWTLEEALKKPVRGMPPGVVENFAETPTDRPLRGTEETA